MISLNSSHREVTELSSTSAVWIQVITCAEFHPHHCNMFAYSSSKGCIRLADMRQAALCDRHLKAFEEPESQVSCAHLGPASTAPVPLHVCVAVQARQSVTIACRDCLHDQKIMLMGSLQHAWLGMCAVQTAVCI